MPFKSQAQRRKFYAMEARGEISPETVKKWESETPKGKKLPEKKRPLKKKSEMVKWTAFIDEVGKISEGGPGDSESSSKTQFPYGPAAGPPSR